MAIAGPEFIIIPPIIVGIIAGIVDMFFMLKDEVGSGGQIIGHGLAAFIPIIIATFASMNLDYIYLLYPALKSGALGNQLVIRVAIAFILAIIIFTKSRIYKGARGTGTHESFLHALIVGIIVAAAPYIWALIKGFFPASITGSGK